VPASLDEMTGELQVAGGAGLPVQLHEGHLDERMPIQLRALARAEGSGQEIAEADRDLQQLPVPGGPMMGNGRLDKVPGAVELVAPGQVRESGGAARGHLDVRIDVTVGLLRRDDEGGRLRLFSGQVRRRFPALFPGDRLQPLVSVRVNEQWALERALILAGRTKQVAERPAFAQPAKAGGYGSRPVYLLPPRPEPADDPAGGKRQGTEGGRRVSGQPHRSRCSLMPEGAFHAAASRKN
jgi:hypothetical protein